MPISLNHLENNVRSVTIHYAGESAQVTYRPRANTPNKNAQRKEEYEEDGTKTTVAMLCAMLISWEVVDNGDPPKPLPITPEVLGDLDDALLVAIINAIQEDMYPKKKSGQR